MVACNTSANQFVTLSATLDTPNPLGFNHEGSWSLNTLTDSDAVLNVMDAKLLGMMIQTEVIRMISPVSGNSLFSKVLTVNNLTSLSLSFNRI